MSIYKQSFDNERRMKSASGKLNKGFVADSGRNFLDDIDEKRYDPLPEKEQTALFERLANGDRSVRETLIRRNMRLMAKIVSNMSKRYDFVVDEMIGHAYVALVNAVDNFNVGFGISFPSYVYPCIVNAVVKGLRELKSNGVTGLNADKKTLTGVRKGSKNKTVDLYPTTFFQPIGYSEPCADDFYVAYDSEHNIYITRKLLRCLTDKQREVVKMHLGIDQFSAWPLECIARELGKSGQAVDKLYKAGIERMRAHYPRLAG